MTEGLRLTFTQKPILSYQPPPELKISEKTSVQLEKEFIPTWLKSGVLREIFIPQLLHFSALFMRPKKNGKNRPIIDLSKLNLLLEIPAFTMETVSIIARSIVEGLWACSIDIKDAYFHLPINWDFHKFFAFKLRNRIFVFQFLPFGLSTAPWAFTRVISPIKKKLHMLMIQIFSYLDDFILFAKSPEELTDAANAALDLLQKLGFTINWEKSALEPARVVEFLGVTWKSDTVLYPFRKTK